MYGLGWLASLNPFNSASTIQEDQVEQTIEEDPEPDPIMQEDTPNTKEMSDLMKAVRNGEKEKVKDIVERTPNILNWTFEKPPLIEAISQMNYAMVELLIDKKPGLASLMFGEDTPLTYIMKPKFKKKPERMKIFMEVLGHATVNQRIGDSQETALHLSIRRRDSEAFAALVKARDIDFNVQNKEDETPLHLATHFNQKDYVHALAYSLNRGGSHRVKFELLDKNKTRADQYGQESGNWLKEIIAAKNDPEKLKALDEEYRNSKDAKVIEVNVTQNFYNSENILINNYQGKHPEQRYLNSENQGLQYQSNPNQSMLKHNQLIQRQYLHVDPHNQHQKPDQHTLSAEDYMQSQNQYLSRQERPVQRPDQYPQRQEQHPQIQDQHHRREDQDLQRRNQHFQRQDPYLRKQDQIPQRQDQRPQRQEQSLIRHENKIYQDPHFIHPHPPQKTSEYSRQGVYLQQVVNQQAGGYSPMLPQHPERINGQTYNASSQYNAHSQRQVYSPPPASMSPQHLHHSASAPSIYFQENQNRPEHYYPPRKAEIPPNQQYTQRMQYPSTLPREPVSPPRGSLPQKLPTETDSYPSHSESYQKNANSYPQNPITYHPDPINHQSTNNYHSSAYNQSSPVSNYPTQPVSHAGEQQKIPQEITSYNPGKSHLLLTPDCAHEKLTGLNRILPQVPYPDCEPTIPNQAKRLPIPDLTTQRKDTISPTRDRTATQSSTRGQQGAVAEPYREAVQSLNKNWIHRELLVKRNCNNRYKMYDYMDQFKTKPNMNRQITV